MNETHKLSHKNFSSSQYFECRVVKLLLLFTGLDWCGDAGFLLIRFGSRSADRSRQLQQVPQQRTQVWCLVYLITSAKEVMFSPVSVCLSVYWITQKLVIIFNEILWNGWI